MSLIRSVFSAKDILMKAFRLLFVFCLAFSLFSLPRPLPLVKISKGTPDLVDILKGYQISVVQELQTCFLARVNRDELSLLRKRGLSVSVLDRDSQGKEHFLVRAPSAAELRVLSEKGQVQQVEPDLYLFWTDSGDPVTLLSPHLERKPLPRFSILPLLKTYPHPESLPLGLQVNDVIATIVGEVSRANLRSHVLSLQSFETRYTSTDNCELAGQFILNYFKAIGLEARFQPFTFGSNISTRNVVAEIKGETDPEEIVIICAHYDSTSSEATIRAPGADDDASGVAAVMEAARILSEHPLDFTVRFIAFSAEEWGLYGSRYHSDGARASSERILGVVNLDMIAYADAMPEDLDVIVNDASWWMAERTGQIADAYTGLAVRKIVNSSFVYSDHSPFWDRGYSAFCGIEDADVNNPYYHTPEDTVDTLNFDFFEDATKTALATLSDFAQPLRLDRPMTPGGLVAESSTYASAFTAVKNVYLTWQSGSDAAGYNVYRTTVPHLGYVKINSSPLSVTSFTDRALRADTAYYYVVTAVWPGGVESNFSREVESPAETPRYEQPELGQDDRSAIWRWRW
jgi:hypothetical protein